ncbi:MAG: M28 family peptidase [Methylobacteriaceae bacterium]|nr:M28 family peptidase [Methylobacteriaceae bacterium]
MTENERAVLSDISLDAPWDLVVTYAKMHRWRPEDVNKGADALGRRLKKLGVPFEMHKPTIYLSIPLDASVKLGRKTFRAKPPSMSLSAPGGVSGPLVYLDADEEKFRSYTRDPKEIFKDGGADGPSRVGGKIAVLNGFANPGTCSLLEEWGARAVIAVNPGVDIHWGTCTTIWGSPDLDDLPRKPKIPVVAVSNPDGQHLIAAAKTGQTAKVAAEMLEGWFMQKVPVVTIPGAVEPERFVLVHGHYDSWEVGVGDNATGDATLLELARVLHKNRSKLRRSVRIAWWPGHSTGRYAGSTWFADHFAEDLDEACVAQINCDSPGCRWATSYHQTTCMPEARDHVADIITEIAGLPPKFKRPNQAGDYSFNNIGISSYYMLSSTMPDDLRAQKNYYAVSGCGGNIAWHTENDTLEIADKNVLMTDMRIYLLSVLRHANASYLPVDWRAAIAEFLATIGAYQKAAGKNFDLSPARQATERLGARLDALYARIARKTIDEARANEALMRLARVLVPINFTQQPRFRHDPAYACPPLPTLASVRDIASAGPERTGFVKTQAMRGQNRYLGALREATRLVDAALA